MKRKSVFLAVGLSMLLVVSGCKYTGGGWVLSNWATKATFAISVSCEGGASGPRYGTVKWSDQDAGVQFTGTVEAVGVLGIPCDLCSIGDNGLALFGDGPVTLYGTYKGIGKNKNATGEFSITIKDNGEGGLSDDDEISLNIASGPYAEGHYSGYGVDCEPIGGGNIQAN